MAAARRRSNGPGRRLSATRTEMIVSASRRTDIPAFYADWFARRLREGFCLVPNPFNPSRVATVPLRREDVDAFVFWTRNPVPFGGVLDELDLRGWPYCFLFTITGYGPPLEPSAPPLDAAVEALLGLSRRIGPDRVIWRYDPILYGGRWGPEWHLDNFAAIARSLEGAVRMVKTSYLDLYRKTARRLRAAGFPDMPDPAERPESPGLLAALGRIARSRGMRLTTCAEAPAVSVPEAEPGACVDPDLLGRISGADLPRCKDAGQRPLCRCAPSRDIGMTDSCGHGCVYCYAVSDGRRALGNLARHDPACPSLLPLPVPPVPGRQDLSEKA